MANKKEEIKLTPEEQQIEKERLERLKKEEKELKLKAKEKQKRRKERESKIRKKEKTEEKRIRKVVSFPFRTLLQLSTFFTLVSFMIIFFGNEIDLMSAIYICSLIFILLYFVVGAVMVIGYWKISEERIQEMESRKKKEKDEENEKLREEEEELEKLLRAEIEDIEDNNSNEDTMLLDSRNLENSFDIPEINLGALENEYGSDNSDNNENHEDPFGSDDYESDNLKENAEKTQEELDSFFSEDDFMNDVIFGTNENKQ